MTDQRRIVLVTGASRGIGRATALALARAGNHIIAIARSEKALTDLDDEIKKLTGQTTTLVPLDLRDFAAVDRLAGALLERFGRLDGLVGNAGVLGTIGPLETVSPQSFTETLDVNLTANWRLIRAVHPLLRMSTAGRALFITSGAAVRHRAFWGPYSATKAGLEAMIDCYADEVENSPIRVNLYDPGPTRTEMRHKAMPGEDPMTQPTPDEVAVPLPFYLSAECDVHGARLSYRDMAKRAAAENG
jgi:NAD(P)-dependent dehydrogenase (short-subunit alcohol dehydrogenase family)